MSESPEWYREMSELITKIETAEVQPDHVEEQLQHYWRKIMNEEQDWAMKHFQQLIQITREHVHQGSSQHTFMEKATVIRDMYIRG